MRQCGIYRIRNIKNDHCYYGSTVDFQNRTKKHLYDLRKGNHHSCYLQAAFNIYGEDSFVFEWVLDVAEDKLLDTEQEHLDKGVYNIAKVADKPPSWEGKKHTTETRKKMSEAQIGHHRLQGVKKSVEHNEKNRQAHLGKVFTEEHCRNISLAKTGRKTQLHTEEYKQAMSRIASQRPRDNHGHFIKTQSNCGV